MADYKAYHTYMESDGEKLFTVVLLPDAEGTFPTVIVRTPYVDRFAAMDEDGIVIDELNGRKNWLKNGYAFVIQHCRGKGKSTGFYYPYINERADGLALQAWIRNQPFYNGELFLLGASYLTSVHYATAPFADDIKGAVFAVQDSERYNICYRNGFFKVGLHGGWFLANTSAGGRKKAHTYNAYSTLPLIDMTKKLMGREYGERFAELLSAPDPKDPYWQTPAGGSETRGCTENVDFPILFVTGFYDIYTGGIFTMWNQMSEKSRKMSALLVSPYDHSDSCDEFENSITFPKGRRDEQFGDYEIRWFNAIRNGNKDFPVPQSEITYYRLFENKWTTGGFEAEARMEIPLGNDEITYTYNPYDPPSFPGGLCTNFGGALYQPKANFRDDVISVYTKPFEKDVFVKGKMTADINVSSDCEDTCFYVRISIEKERGDFGLRDDITSLCYQIGDYTPGNKVKLKFEFDEHAFLIRKGERLRIDIASADSRHYVRHTNKKGLYCMHDTAEIANNTVYLEDSCLVLPVEE